MLPQASFCDGLPWPSNWTPLDEALDGADVVMVLRMQLERQTAGMFPSLREYVRTYGLTEERLARAKAKVRWSCTPGQRTRGVEIDQESRAASQSVIEAQVTNGVAVRMALLYLLSGLPS
jgi:aspartate carbamoyltransferase catalytic subunit